MNCRRCPVTRVATRAAALVLALLFGAMAASAEELTYLGAKLLADHDEASLTPAEMEALHVAQGVAGGQSFAACSPPSSAAELTPFTVVMKLDESGKVIQTWLEGDSVIASCFNAAIATKSLNKPPYAPFYTYFAMSWQPREGE